METVSPSSPANPAPGPDRPAVPLGRWADLIIAAAGLLCFGNGLRGVFIFDDLTAITQNPSLEHIWPPWAALHPPDNLTLSGRPIANWTFALNHVLGGTNPAGYHLLNILIHIGAALALFGIARRTLAKERFSADVRAAAETIALGIAILWMLHPLQTESVTYVVQRVETLMGFFYLLTLYCFIRATEPGGARAWFVGGALACALGMGTKEVMVSAPLAVWLYDRTFVAGTFGGAWRQRRGFYLGLAATWGLLLALVVSGHNRGGSAGFEAGGSPWHYALTQCQAIVHYLRLVFWPHPLVFDYGNAVVTSPTTVLGPALLLAGLVGLTFVGLRKNLPAGWLGFCFFAILAPSSSVMPVVTQSMAEHRMYLSLAAVIVLVVYGSFRWLGKWSPALWAAGAVACGGLTVARNQDYRSEVGMWRDNIAKWPQNARAYDALGNALADQGQQAEAAEAFRQAVAVDPTYVGGYNNLGATLNRLKDEEGARKQFLRALEINPKYGAAHFNLGEMLARNGDYAGAKACYLKAIEYTPQEPTPLVHLGTLEMQHGDADAALEHYQAALKLRPNDTATWFNVGFLHANQGRLVEAADAFAEAAKIAPRSALAHYNLANAKAQLHLLPAAVDEYKSAVALDPKLTAAYFNLGNTLALLKRYDEAMEQYEIVLKLEPNHAGAAANLAEARMRKVLGP